MFNSLITVKLFFLNLFETDKEEKEIFLRLSLGLLSTIIILILINFVIYSIYPNNSEAIAIQAKQLVVQQQQFWIWPEPVEHFQILISIICIPLLIFCSIKVFSAKAFSRILITDFMYYLNVALWFLFLAVLFYLAFKFDDPNNWPPRLKYGIRIFFKTMTGELRFFITLIIFPLITYFIFNGVTNKYYKFVNWVFYLLVLFFLSIMFLFSICNMETYLGTEQNITSVLYSVSQVQQGRALLADFTAQYGLYPHFLYPIFKFINVNVLSFSITMSLLTVTSYSFIFFGLRKIINNNFVVCFSFFAIIYFSYFYSFLDGGWFDLRYAVNPIRMLFPALILFLVFTYILNPKKILYLFIIFLSSLSILWNFDSGVICFLSFYIYVLYEKIASNNLRSYAFTFIKHSIITASILAVTFFLFSIVIYLQSNSFPNWNLFLKFPSLFGMTGFGSMPMPIFHAWNLVFLVYLYGIYTGLNSVLLNKKIVKDRAAFFVAIFGIGISSYYLNRSHDFNLLPVSYPCFILLAIYLSKLLDSGRVNLFRIKNFLSALIISFVLVTIFIQMLQPTRLFNIVAGRTQNIINNTLNSKFLSDGIELIKSNTNPNEQIVILIADQDKGWIPGPDATLHLETKTSSPFIIPGSTELLFQSDLNILNQSLADNISHKVFIDFTGQTKYHPLMKIIDDNYFLAARLGDWRMYLPISFKSNIEPIQ